jgi:antitoxin HigA-1
MSVQKRQRVNLQTLYELRLARKEVGDRVKKLPRRTDRKLKAKHESAYPP